MVIAPRRGSSTFLCLKEKLQKKQTNLQFDCLCKFFINSPCFISAYFSADRRMAKVIVQTWRMRTLFWRRFIFSPFPHSWLWGSDLNDKTFKICTQIYWSQARKSKKFLPRRLCVIESFIRLSAKSRERPRAAGASGEQTCLRRVFSGFAWLNFKICTIGQAERLCIFWYFSLHKKSTEHPPQAEGLRIFCYFFYIRKVQYPHRFIKNIFILLIYYQKYDIIK